MTMLRWFKAWFVGDSCGLYVRLDMSNGYCIGRFCRRFKHHTGKHWLSYSDEELKTMTEWKSADRAS